MTARPEASQIRHWQEEVARDPGSPAFVLLAEVYRREGRLDVARRLCLRGLERQPEHVEAHVLLARIYRETGDLERAADELDIALGLQPDHRTARRALAYLYLERREWAAAVRHLEMAAQHDPTDPRLASALALARRHHAAPAAPEAAAADALGGALERFARDARARLAVLIAGSGRIVSRVGAAGDLDLAGFTSLAAGIHAASRELALMLGQSGFRQLYQGQGERQLFLGPVPTVGEELVLIALFGTDTTIGLVRVRFEEFVREAALCEAPLRPRPTRPDAAAFEAELAAGLARASAAPGATGLHRAAPPLS